MSKIVEGFSKLTKEEKIDWLVTHYFNDNKKSVQVLKTYWNTDVQLQKLHEEFAENTISNYYLPFSIAPNFLINDRQYALPMTIEESSVVAAASKAAKFWLQRGGFTAEVLNTEKVGQVHFTFDGAYKDLLTFFEKHKNHFFTGTKDLTANMEKRGGGILDIQLMDKSASIPGYYQLHCTFQTVDAMGANFINSCLERFADILLTESKNYMFFKEHKITVIMSILSNYVPNCIVKAQVSCAIKDLPNTNKLSSLGYAEKFKQAVDIAMVEPYRAVTHNKGIMNGIDALVLATGNDFRAVEAGVHAFAARDGVYKSLTNVTLTDDTFTFSIEIPLALGTVGGLTSLHPLVKLALELLQHPNAEELMQITAVAGLAQNFAAINSLITTGIQQGHMKMHLMNILNSLQASPTEKEKAITYFKKEPVSYSKAVSLLETLRN
ncbi:hydroxymethylglutaryl-CoA reductase, degradative [Aquimarina sp. ERC-38]|uniref:hydroxymethylglutaryl-CoA reductase, degradative n=1 Tax=Aquimarina sp. ERC-38 TaxID=2949996 RepID=UPI0022483D94|nr:hydroxymethylglutaryl-CoA reductase, degradative [Aquimarina sp. ERC-38]UZO81294.1 hydroxymethylglutaryl-CoA reductase, degradative [Aquimarina sp. ERC-38]